MPKVPSPFPGNCQVSVPYGMHLELFPDNMQVVTPENQAWIQQSKDIICKIGSGPYIEMIEYFFPILGHFCLHFVQLAQTSLILSRLGLILPRMPPQALFFTQQPHTPFGNMYIHKTPPTGLNPTQAPLFHWKSKMNYHLGEIRPQLVNMPSGGWGLKTPLAWPSRMQGKTMAKHLLWLLLWGTIIAIITPMHRPAHAAES